MAFVRVLDADGLKPGAVTCVRVGERRLALARVGDDWFALDDTCSHMQESLSEGYVDGECLYCPLHQSGFDLRTGQALSQPATAPVAAYAVKVEGGGVWVDVEAARG